MSAEALEAFLNREQLPSDEEIFRIINSQPGLDPSYISNFIIPEWKAEWIAKHGRPQYKPVLPSLPAVRRTEIPRGSSWERDCADQLAARDRRLEQSQALLNDALVILYNVPNLPLMESQDQTLLANKYTELFQRLPQFTEVYGLLDVLKNPQQQGLTACLQTQAEIERQLSALQGIKEENDRLKKDQRTERSKLSVTLKLLHDLANYPLMEESKKAEYAQAYSTILGKAIQQKLVEFTEIPNLIDCPPTDPFELLDLQSQNQTLQQRLNDTGEALEQAEQLVNQLRTQQPQIDTQLVSDLDQCHQKLKECQDRNTLARKTAEEMSKDLQIQPGTVSKHRLALEKLDADRQIALESLALKRESQAVSNLSDQLEECRAERKRLAEENARLKSAESVTFDQQKFTQLSSQNERLSKELAEKTRDLEQALKDYQGNTGDIQLCQADIEQLQQIIETLAEQKQDLVQAVRQCLAAGQACSAIEGFQEVYDQMKSGLKEFTQIQVPTAKTLVSGSGFYRRPNFQKIVDQANRI